MLSLLLAPSASAAEGVPARLVWDGSTCGSEQDFAARVMQRNRAIRFVSSGEQVAVRLSIQPTSGGLDARVRIEAKGRAPVIRRIQSPDCDDALDALALVVAIGVEGRPTSSGRRPRARATARTPVAPEAAAPPSAAPLPPAPPTPPPGEQAPLPMTEGPAPEPGATSGTVEATPVTGMSVETLDVPPAGTGSALTAAPPVGDAGTPDVASDAGSGRLLLGAGLAALSSVGIAPEPMLGGGVWVSAEWDREGAWAPEVVLDAMHQERGGHDEARGEADFELNALSLALCPVRFGRPTLELRPCVSGALGQLVSDGGQTYAPRDQTRPWSSIGASLSLSVVIGIVELRASLGASTPLQRDSFRFGPDCSGAACEADVFHRVESLIWTGALGAGLTPR